MVNTVKIAQWPTPIGVAPGQTILEAALAQGVPYPHGCRSGNCGACKSRVHGGAVDMAAYSAYALSPGERAAGLVLACRARPREDVEIAWSAQEDAEAAAHPIRRIAAEVVGLDALTHDIRRLRLRLPTEPLAFTAGQYASLTFAGCKPRDYSMANRPDDPVLEFHVRAMPAGSASAFVHERLRPGDRVLVEGPFGSSHLREQHRGPVIALAGGSGLAPILSIVETALAKGLPQPIYLYFGARDERDVYAEDRLKALAAAHPRFRFTVVLSEPSGQTNRRTGFVHAAVAADFDELDGCKAYLAGPPAMVEAGKA